MITEKDLQEAIAECQGVRNPDARTCYKLAAYLTIYRELYGEPFGNSEQFGYSYAPPPLPEPAENQSVEYESGTPFWNTVRDMDKAQVWPIVDELMTTLAALYPRLYNGVIRELRA